MVRPLVSVSSLTILATVPVDHSMWGGGDEKGDQGRTQAWNTKQQCGYILKMKATDSNSTKFTNCQKDVWPNKIQRPPEISFG